MIATMTINALSLATMREYPAALSQC